MLIYFITIQIILFTNNLSTFTIISKLCDESKHEFCCSDVPIKKTNIFKENCPGKKCATAQIEVKNYNSKSFIPECDSNGQFKIIQRIFDGICICVNSEGKELSKQDVVKNCRGSSLCSIYNMCTDENIIPTINECRDIYDGCNSSLLFCNSFNKFSSVYCRASCGFCSLEKHSMIQAYGDIQQSCDTPININKDCGGHAEARWYYDEHDYLCKLISYTGCFEHRNYFKTYFSCMIKCKRSPTNIQSQKNRFSKYLHSLLLPDKNSNYQKKLPFRITNISNRTTTAKITYLETPPNQLMLNKIVSSDEDVTDKIREITIVGTSSSSSSYTTPQTSATTENTETTESQENVIQTTLTQVNENNNNQHHNPNNNGDELLNDSDEMNHKTISIDPNTDLLNYSIAIEVKYVNFEEPDDDHLTDTNKHATEQPTISDNILTTTINDDAKDKTEDFNVEEYEVGEDIEEDIDVTDTLLINNRPLISNNLIIGCESEYGCCPGSSVAATGPNFEGCLAESDHDKCDSPINLVPCTEKSMEFNKMNGSPAAWYWNEVDGNCHEYPELYSCGYGGNYFTTFQSCKLCSLRHH